MHAQQRNANAENIPPQPEQAPAHGRIATPEPLTPLRYLHNANQRLADERQQNEVRSRDLRNTLLREKRLRDTQARLKTKLKDAEAQHRVGNATVKAELKAAREELAEVQVKLIEADEERARVEAEAKREAAEAEREALEAARRARSAEGRVEMAEMGLARAEAWAHVAEARAAEVEAAMGVVCAQAADANEQAQMAKLQAQASEARTQLVAAQYSEALRGLAVDMQNSRQAAVTAVQDEANDAMKLAEFHAAAAIHEAHSRAEAAEARSRAAEDAASDAWTNAAATVEAMRIQFAARIEELEMQAHSTVSSIVYLAQLAVSDQEARIEAALEVERQDHTTELEEAHETIEQERQKARAAEARADTMEVEVEQRLFEAMNEAEGYLELARQMLESQASQTDELTDLRVQLEDTLSTSSALRDRVDTLSKKNKALKHQVLRAQDSAAAAQSVNTPSETGGSVLKLKHKGIIPDSTRNLIRDLISFGLKVHQVREVIEAVADVAGAVVDGNISERSVRRITLEGMIASELQVAVESKSAEGITISSDGTTHKNVNYDSRHLHLNTGDSHIRRTLGIQSSHNHTSQSQLTGWKSRVQSVLDTYNASPLGCDEPLDTKTFLQKVYGMLTDHAEDQKCLKRLFSEWKRQVDREVRGERAMAELAPLDLLPILAEEVSAAMDNAGGTEAWSMLTNEELDEANMAIRQSVITRLGEASYAALPEADKQLASLFVHAGCCMHKELNAVKGG
ncbi:hypothetical protein ONZ51_g5623 [Trametes cubensis]|uniref:Uncharacterized protein n=1 Tax=Trametes cubensis TaxID=1111947 RepID=A0AAD7TTP3_9APHY|nr:hypothetical protein ONZ51_g5623 [Trametes cubensis]